MPVDEYRKMENPFVYAYRNFFNSPQTIDESPTPMDEKNYYIKGGMKHYY